MQGNRLKNARVTFDQKSPDHIHNEQILHLYLKPDLDKLG